MVIIFDEKTDLLGVFNDAQGFLKGKRASEARRRETQQSAGRPSGGEAFPTLQLLTIKVSRFERLASLGFSSTCRTCSRHHLGPESIREDWENRRIRISKLRSLSGQIGLPSSRPYLILTMDGLTRDYCARYSHTSCTPSFGNPIVLACDIVPILRLDELQSGCQSRNY